MKPTGFSVIYINGSPHVAIHTDDGCEWPVLTIENAEKAFGFLAKAIDQVKTDQQKRKFTDFLAKTSEEVATWPEWKQNLLGKVR